MKRHPILGHAKICLPTYADLLCKQELRESIGIHVGNGIELYGHRPFSTGNCNVNEGHGKKKVAYIENGPVVKGVGG